MLIRLMVHGAMCNPIADLHQFIFIHDPQNFLLFSKYMTFELLYTVCIVLPIGTCTVCVMKDHRIKVSSAS